MSGVLAFAEVRGGEVKRVSQEVVTAARTLADGLGQEVHALVIGSGIGDGAAGLKEFGADRILVADNGDYERYNAEGFTAVVEKAVAEHGCDVLVFPATAMGKDLAPRVAARLDAGYAADCTELAVEGDKVMATRPRVAGKIFSRVGFAKRPAVISIRPNAFTPEAKAGSGEVTEISADGAADWGAIVREIRASAGESQDVAEASIVVSGGRGLREAENFKLIEELAEALGGAVGASRAVVDAGWRPHSEQVGQTGKTVAPQLYFAIGISGAIQHLAGMKTSRYIVAINKDPDAPIFKIADYGIVGDLFEVVPRLTEEIRKLPR